MSRSRDLTVVSMFRDSYCHVSIYGYSDKIVVREGVGTPPFARLASFVE
jgi:hypothetical protein